MRNRSLERRGGQAQRGASLVEFALVAPILSMLLFGIVQFAIAYDTKQAVSSAAREGARSAAIPSNEYADIDDAVEMSFQGLVDGSVDTAVSVHDGSTTLYDSEVGDSGSPCATHEGLTVVVEVGVDHEISIPFWGTETVDLSGRGEFRCERT